MTHGVLRTLQDLETAELTAVNNRTALEEVARRYAIAITPAMRNLIDPGDAADPIAAQFVPTRDELTIAPEELNDPIGDGAHSPVTGVVHRYPDRVLLKALNTCPVYCRFCFRREMVGPGGDGNLNGGELDEALKYIADNADIWEVILTGGDPLVMSSRRLRQIAEALAAIPHVRILRIHTRVPAVSPERIDDALIEALKASGKTVYVALHANHPRELSPEAREACARLIDSGIVMVSQTVLLKGVNDDVEVLAELMRAFVESRVKPYYLHHPDLAPGTGHFRLPIERGQEILRALRARISGLCLPAYILDLPGGHGKVSIGEGGLSRIGSGRYSVLDRHGRRQNYP